MSDKVQSTGRHRDVVRGHSASPDAVAAAAELADQLGAGPFAAVVFFCSPAYDLEALGGALESHFDCPLVGCTTAGEIISPFGYLTESLVGVAFSADAFSVDTRVWPDLSACLDESEEGHWPHAEAEGDKRSFGLLLIDGLAMLEERVVSKIQGYLRDVPLVGGSAGDGLQFQQTRVYFDGAFQDRAAALLIFSTRLPFKLFQIKNLQPTSDKLVVTEADPPSRTVREINGRPAAEEYAQTVGVDIEALSAEQFARHPLMLRMGGEYYVRSIQRVNPDRSLTFYCAIDNGLVLTLAESQPMVEDVRRAFAELAEAVPGLQLVLVCDCILRRLELVERGELSALREVLADYPFAGFSTYGEQLGSIHMNQTLTGVAIGALHD
jgi:hypothetical protein